MKTLNQIKTFLFGKKITKKNLEKLFPLHAVVDVNDIRTADKYDDIDCYGVRTLRRALGSSFNGDMAIRWYNSTGTIYLDKHHTRLIVVEANKSIMNIKEQDDLNVIFTIS